MHALGDDRRAEDVLEKLEKLHIAKNYRFL